MVRINVSTTITYLDMATFLMILQKRKPSSIIVTTSAVHLTLQTNTPTSHSAADASFVENLINNGGNVQRAYSQIDWEGAGKDAVVAGVMSLVVSGASTIKLVKKRLTIDIGKSNPARILVNTAVSRVSGITAEVWKEV